MTKRLLILFSFALCFNSWGITHAECEALKSDINSRLDTIDYTVSSTLSFVADIDDIILNTYTVRFNNTDPTDPGSLQSTQSTYYLDSSGNPLGTLGEIHNKLNSVRSDLNVVSNNTAYIRGLLLSVNCDDTTNGCNCAEQLASISQQVDSIFGVLSQNRTDFVQLLSDFYTWEELWEAQNETILSMFDNVNVFLTLYTNSYLRGFLLSTGTTQTDLPNVIGSDLVRYYGYKELVADLSRIDSSVPNTRASGRAHLWNMLNSYGNLIPRAVSSLNRWSNAHWLQLNQLTNSVVSVETNVSDVSSKFSIFNDFVFSSEVPLSMYNDTDGSYHDYLTNYYIKVSKGQQSGSDNFTNWFSRIEILLASLVFQDDGTNFVDEAVDTSQMDNTFSQSVDTLSQAVSLPEGVTGKIDNMGQSFLGLLGEWRTIVNGNSLPSQFVLCDINLSSQNRDSSGGSSVSSFRLETSLDSGPFRQFLDFCHAVTTILFTMLFLWLSIMLLSFLLASLAKLVHFCYVVYSALFGG